MMVTQVLDGREQLMKMKLSGRLRLTDRMPRELFDGWGDALVSVVGAQIPELSFSV
jgi:hypothetical protein